MKILFINTIDSIGGAALVIQNLGQQLRRQGHDVKYIVGFKKSQDQEVYQLKKNLLANYLTQKTCWDFNFICRGIITKIFANDITFGAAEEIISHPWYKAADIVHCNNLHGNFMKLELIVRISREKKMLWTLHDGWAILAHGANITEERIQDGFYRRSQLNTYPAMVWNNEKYLTFKKKNIYAKSNFEIAVPSLWIKEKVDRSILASKKVHLVHNGINTNVFKKHDKIESRKKLGLPLDKKIILFVADSGKNNKNKGWAYIEKVISHYARDDSKFFLCVGGTGADEKKSRGNMKFVGYIKQGDLLAQYYSASDIFLFTSLVESFGLVPIEAMSCGLPVVAFPVGIIPEIIYHKRNGYIAKHRDAEDLIQGIEYIMAFSDSVISNISQELTEKIRSSFSLDKMTAEYIKIYDNLLKNEETFN